MKVLAPLLFLLPIGACLAQTPYRYVVDTPLQLGQQAVPAYRSFADTTGKPFTKLFPRSAATLVGRIGTRWAVLQKRDTEYLVRTRDLPAAGQQAVVAAHLLPSLPVDTATGRLLYGDVILVPDASQAELYARAQLWFADTFASAKEVVQVANKEAGVIQGTAFSPLAFGEPGAQSLVRLWYTVKLVVKDGRYKYDFTDFQLQEYPASPTYDTPYIVESAPVPVEGYLNLEQKKGTDRRLARAARRELAVASLGLTSALQAGMSKSVAGPTAGKE
jgi:hypothetical protein